MASYINASSTGTGGLLYSGDASGNLVLQTNGSTVLTVTNNGLIGIGTSTATETTHISGGVLRIDGITGECGPYLYRAGNNAPDLRFFTSNGTISSPATVSNGTNAGQIHFEVHDGTNYLDRAGIWGIVDTAVSTGTVGVALRMMTGTTGTSEQMRIASSGKVSIGSSSSGQQKLTIFSSSGETGIGFSESSTNGRTYELITGGSGGAFSGGAFGIYDRTAGAARLLIDSSGIVDLYGGGGGAQLRLRNGGDLQIFNSANSGSASLYCDTGGQLDTLDSLSVGANMSFNSGYGSARLAYGVRAWVKHTGGVTVQGSGGISSITYHGTGDYTYNFNFTMPDTNYSTVAQGSGEVSTYHTVPHLWYIRNTYSTTACSIGWFNVTNSGGRTNHTIGCVHWVR